MATDPLAGSDLARVPLPENVYGFGWAEMRYLLGRHATPSSQMALTSLGFNAAPDDEVVAAAGVASLLARGLAAARGDQATSRGEAAVLETVFARGLRWSGISSRDGEHSEHGQHGDLMVVIEDGGIIAMLQPRSLGTWFVGLNDEVDHPGPVLARAIEAMRQMQGGTGRFALETRTLDGEPTTRFLWPTDGGWSVADLPEAERRPVSGAELGAFLTRLLPPVRG
ncbi:MAG: hypothetical protein L0H96_14000 [Humibacillus sp.]|nr:hypothetical protein [Humibacillus sp.]MDN5778010.1 hypothetical protein [Humibacillus sp.]